MSEAATKKKLKRHYCSSEDDAIHWSYYQSPSKIKYIQMNLFWRDLMSFKEKLLWVEGPTLVNLLLCLKAEVKGGCLSPPLSWAQVCMGWKGSDTRYLFHVAFPHLAGQAYNSGIFAAGSKMLNGLAFIQPDLEQSGVNVPFKSEFIAVALRYLRQHCLLELK